METVPTIITALLVLSRGAGTVSNTLICDSLKILYQVQLPHLKTPFQVIAARANGGNHHQATIAIRPGNLFCLKDQAGSQTGVLRGAILFRPDWKRLSVDMYFPDYCRRLQII